MPDCDPAHRTAFFVSDGTGITAETLGRSLITQFEQVAFTEQSLRFVNTLERAEQARGRINEVARSDQARPLVFSTLIKPELRTIVMDSNSLFLDMFDTFVSPLSQELGCRPSASFGRFHGMQDVNEYSARIEAMNFTLHHDDGSTTRQLDQADIIVIGISRTGKTPTCLYLSIQYGVRAANFPITEDDLERPGLPGTLQGYRSKLLALTTESRRLQQIRQARYPDSRYASLDQCEFEIRQAEGLYRRLGIPCIKTTLKSIEEIAATIIDLAALDRRTAPGPTRSHV
jgi:hypothetical protein